MTNVHLMLTTHSCCIASSSGNYDQLDDELTADPLRVTLFDADEKKLWSSPLGAPEGTFSVASTGGRNMLCITNGIEPGMDDDASQEADAPVGRRSRTSAAKETLTSIGVCFADDVGRRL